jgi:sugar phosphate isomerase/epimerase
MKACISQVTTLNEPFEADLESYARSGWRAVELWLTKLERFLEGHEVGEVRRRLDDLGLAAAGASQQGGLLLSEGAERQAHWDHFRRRLGVLQALGTGTLVIVPDFAREPAGGDLSRAIASLAEAAELAGRHGVRLALEFQKSARFCASLDTAVALAAQAESAHVGVCLDAFHYYTGPSKFEDLGYLTPDLLAWVQLCDLTGTPRELAGDADRILPGDGDFALDPILDHLHAIGYDGHASVEVMNPNLWAIPGDRVADVALRAIERTLGSRANPSEVGAPAPGAGGA